MKSYKRIGSIQKACAILKFLGSSKEPVSAPDIAKAVDLAVGTACCHLATLEDAGFAQRIGDRWEIGMASALAWARKKSSLEGRRMLIESQLKELEAGNV